MHPLCGLRIIVDQHLAGMKKAAQVGDRLFVSPAMFDLLEHAEGGYEFARLLARIPRIALPPSILEPPTLGVTFDPFV